MPTQRHSDLVSAATYTTHIQHADTSPTTSPPSTLLQQRDTLPPALQHAVPQCARACVSNYISQQFTGCYNNENLDCLCTKYSSEGYTLGELAFVCLEQACQEATYNERQNTYGICGAQANAVNATHSTLTLPATTTKTLGITTTTLEVYATGSPSEQSSSTRSRTTLETSIRPAGSATPAITDTAMPVATAAATLSSTSSTTSSSTAAAKAGHDSTTLTSGQAVGVSVAAFGGLAVLIMVIWLCACLRRRKASCKSPSTKHDSYDFIDDAPPRFSPFHYGYADPRGPLGGFAGQRAELPDEKRSMWYANQFPGQNTPEKYGSFGLGLGHQLQFGGGKSNDSMRTVSQLLPDKPGQTPPVPPAKHFTPRPSSMRSPETVFEEHSTPRLPSLQPPPRPQRPEAAHLPYLPGKNVRISPQYAAQYTRSPDEVRQPSLSIELPRKASRPALKVPSPIRITPPPIPEVTAAAPGDRTSRGSKAKSGASGASGISLLDYYTSPTELEYQLPTNPLGSPLTPISLEPQRRMKPVPAAITVTKPTYPPKAVRRTSTETYRSDTSFESTDPDEPTPPEQDKQLSPVAEHSPIAAIKYPKVPRSSNQSIPRSPVVKLKSPKSPRRPQQMLKDDRTTLPSHSHQASRDKRSPKTPERQDTDASTLSGSTLAQKRRGRSTDQGRGKRLYIDTSRTRTGSTARTKVNSDPHSSVNTPPKRTQQGSPLKGYGRVTSTAPNSGGARRYSRTNPTGLPTSRSDGGLLTPEMASPRARVVKKYAVDRDGYGTQEVCLKSPLWEPKLTPSRKGEDLYLEVGVATPGIMSPATPMNFDLRSAR